MSLKKNVLANYLGQGWTALMGIAFVPLYIKYLGMEAYGLIGVFAILQAWLALLDMGMTPTLTREMARYTAGAHTAQSIRDLLRSLEIICIGLAALSGVLIWVTSDWLASEWLQADKLPVATVAHAIAIMGFVAALRFVEGIYRGAIIGLQKQVFFNVVNSFFATFRAVGAVAVLIWWSPTIDVYFIWQGIVSVVSVVTLSLVAHGCLPKAPVRPQFSRHALMEIRHFAGGMMATTLLTLLLTQSDKILLSRLLSLETFGYYTLAATVVIAISLLIAPITQAFYPRFTELVVTGETATLVQTYHHSAQLVTVLAATPALMLMFFGENILLLWTGNSVLAHSVAPLLALLALGTLLNGLMQIPYLLTLANGWPSFAVWMNMVAVVILVPAILWAATRYGAMGAAWALVLLNVGYVLIGIHFMHRRLLPLEKWRWYMHDVAMPMLAATLVAFCFRAVQPVVLGEPAQLVWLLFSALCIICSAIYATNELRSSFAQHIYRIIKTNA